MATAADTATAVVADTLTAVVADMGTVIAGVTAMAVVAAMRAVTDMLAGDRLVAATLAAVVVTPVDVVMVAAVATVAGARVAVASVAVAVVVAASAVADTPAAALAAAVAAVVAAASAAAAMAAAVVVTGKELDSGKKARLLRQAGLFTFGVHEGAGGNEACEEFFENPTHRDEPVMNGTPGFFSRRDFLEQSVDYLATAKDASRSAMRSAAAG
jgi:hypothetical protein